jgi:hypothetical protein
LNPAFIITTSKGSLVLMGRDFSIEEKESQNNYFYNYFIFKKKEGLPVHVLTFCLKIPTIWGLRVLRK